MDEEELQLWVPHFAPILANLVQLTMSNTTVRPEILLPLVPMLKSLCISEFELNTDLPAFKTFIKNPKSPDLTSLKIQSSSGLTLHVVFRLFPHLTVLKLEDCPSVFEDELIVGKKHLRLKDIATPIGLEKLSITIDSLDSTDDDNAFDSFLRHCANLKVLKLCCYDMPEVNRMSKLVNNNLGLERVRFNGFDLGRNFVSLVATLPKLSAFRFNVLDLRTLLTLSPVASTLCELYIEEVVRPQEPSSYNDVTQLLYQMQKLHTISVPCPMKLDFQKFPNLRKVRLLQNSPHVKVRSTTLTELIMDDAEIFVATIECPNLDSISLNSDLFILNCNAPKLAHLKYCNTLKSISQITLSSMMLEELNVKLANSIESLTLDLPLLHRFVGSIHVLKYVSIGQLNALRYLCLYRCDIQQEVLGPLLKQLCVLEVIEFSGCRYVQGATDNTSLDSVRELRIDGTQQDQEPFFEMLAIWFAQIVSIEVNELQSPELVSNFVKHVKKWKKLRRLMLKNIEGTIGECNNLMKAVTHVEHLQLYEFKSASTITSFNVSIESNALRILKLEHSLVVLDAPQLQDCTLSSFKQSDHLDASTAMELAKEIAKCTLLRYLVLKVTIPSTVLEEFVKLIVASNPKLQFLQCTLNEDHDIASTYLRMREQYSMIDFSFGTEQ